MTKYVVAVLCALSGLACGSKPCTPDVTQIDIEKGAGGSYVKDGAACGFMNSGQLTFDLTKLHDDLEGFQVSVGSQPTSGTHDCTDASVFAAMTMRDRADEGDVFQDFGEETCTLQLTHPKLGQEGKASGEFTGTLSRPSLSGDAQTVTVRFNFNVDSASSAPEE